MMTLLERVPPQSLEAEQATLGAMLVERDAIIEVADTLHADDFYSPQHQMLYRVIVDLFRDSQPVDIVTLQSRLQDRDQLEATGGGAYLIDLQESAPTAAAVGNYARIVRDKSTLRKLIRAGGEIAEMASGAGEEDAAEILTRAQGKLSAIDGAAALAEGFVPWSQAVTEAYNAVAEQMTSDRHVLGIPTGLEMLDRYISGWQPSVYYIVAARPSIGKTALALAQATDAAERGKRVALFSLEMAREAMARRDMARRMEINLARLTGGYIDQRDLDGLALLASEQYKWPLFICERSDLRIGQLRAEARQLARRQGGLDLIFVDYLQLVGCDTRGRSRNDELGEVSKGMKAMAQELKCSVVVLSQLSRECEKERRRPRLADLRESGNIEQDADVVMFLSWPIWESDFQDNGKPNPRMRLLDVHKQRNGPTRAFAVSWEGKYQRFADLEVDREEEQWWTRD